MCRVTFTLLLLAASVSAAAAAPTSGQPDTNLIDKVIVYIECKSPDGTKTSEGTGVLVSSDGAVLTAKHVVPEGYACLGGIGTAATTPTRKLIPDPRQAPVDAMLLRFVRTGDEVFPFVRYRKIKPSLRGKPIIAYGFPVGQVGDVYQSEGTIAQTNIDARGIFGTTTLESHGMSGGPVVLKEDGNLIGIVVGADFDPTTGAPSSYGVLAAQMVANVFNLTAAEPPSPPGKKLGASPGAQNLPSTQQFNSALTTCATNSNISISADLLGSVSSVYEGNKTRGTANFTTATKFLELFPKADRAKMYELYTNCITKILHLGSVSSPHYVVKFTGGILHVFNPGGKTLDTDIDVQGRLALYANTCHSANGLYELNQSFYIWIMQYDTSQDQTTVEVDPRLILKPFIDGPGSDRLQKLENGSACFIADRQELELGIDASYKDTTGKSFEDCFSAHIFRDGSRIDADSITRKLCKTLFAKIRRWSNDLPRISLWPSPLSLQALTPLWRRVNSFASEPDHSIICVIGCDQ